MIGSIWRGVQFVQRVDDEAAAAQDLDPLAVAGVELYPSRGVTRRCAWRCGWSSSCPAGPSSPGEHTVTRMLVVWKTSFPPGRSSLAASGTQRAGSHHKLAPHSEMARSKLPEGSGISPASASTSGKVMPNRSWQRRADSSWAGVTSTPIGRAPRRASQAEKYAVPQPSSTTSKPRTSPSTSSCCSGTLKMPQVMSLAAQARWACSSGYSLFAWVHSSGWRRPHPPRLRPQPSVPPPRIPATCPCHDKGEVHRPPRAPR